MNSKDVLLFIIGLGFLLRLAFLLFSNHLYYPDELFQSLEPAYRLVHGYGIVPWEFRVGLRSWIIPGVVAGILWVIKQLGLDQPVQYDLAIRLILSIFSLSSIWATFIITRFLTGKERVALAVAFASAVWYEWVYVAPRPLSEVIASNLLLSGMALILQVIATRQSLGDRKRYEVQSDVEKLPSLAAKAAGPAMTYGAGFLLGLGTYLRIQYFLIPLLFLLYLYKKNKNINLVKTIGCGLGVGILFGGWIDYLTWGHWFYSITQNISLSFGAGISQVFGTQPWYWYIKQLVLASGGLFLIGLAMPRKYRFLGWFILASLGLHSVFAHKEYRFVVILIPLLLVAASIGYFELTKSYLSSRKRLLSWMVLVTLVSGLGFFTQLPGQTQVFTTAILNQDPKLKLFSRLSETNEVCGLLDSTGNWMETGGSYYLGKNLLLYSRDYLPTKESFVSHVLVDAANPPLTGFEKVGQEGHIILYQRKGACEKDPTYTWDRYIPEVEEILGGL